MNPIITLTKDNLELTKRMIESVRRQTVPTSVLVIDNDSRDGTTEWLSQQGISFFSFSPQIGVSAGWNRGLNLIFQRLSATHCLVVNNDTVLPPWFHKELLSYDVPFVTGVAVDDMAMIEYPPTTRMPLTPNPDFSAFLIRRDCWDKVGPFDERMKLYASDCDFHVRAHRLGVPLYKACVPYYHERSSTLNNSRPGERDDIQRQANEDRAIFRKLYGCLPGEPVYSALFESMVQPSI